MSRDQRFLILADGLFGPDSSKTANACIRYTPERVVGVIDATRAGRTAQHVLGFGGDIPVVATLDEGLALKPNALLIGIAPAGGKLPAEWIRLVAHAIEHGLEIWSGLHTFIGDVPELAALAAEHGVAIHDLRRPPANLDVSRRPRARHRRDDRAHRRHRLQHRQDDDAAAAPRRAPRAGASARRSPRRARRASSSKAVASRVDAVVADFIAGAAERLVLERAKDADLVLVEGQGSIIHPSYSGVTYGLMHGSLPHAQVMCAQPTRTAINGCEWVKIPPLADFIRLSELALAPLRPAPVIAVALNTFDLGEDAARRVVEDTAARDGPSDDRPRALRSGADRGRDRAVPWRAVR